MDKKEKNFSKVAGQGGKVFKDGKVYKPIRVGNGEHMFYENVKEKYPFLLPYLPKYFGLHRTKKQAYLILENICSSYSVPALMDLKIGKNYHQQEPRARNGVCNLFGCYVSGVHSTNVKYRNRVNGYKGKDTPLEHFHEVLVSYLREMGPQERLVHQLSDFHRDLKRVAGTFYSASILLTFDEQDAPGPKANAHMHFIDFERFHPHKRSVEPDHHLLRSIRHVLYIMRREWFGFVPTIYLVRNGERYDYTDPEWGLISTHPHDSPLSSRGDSQAVDVVDRLCISRPHLIVSSPFQRAILTAEPLAEYHNMDICIEPGLVEFLCMETRIKVPSFISESVNISPWVSKTHKPVPCPVQLEDWEGMCRRTRDTLQVLIDACNGKGDLVIFSHRTTLTGMYNALVQDDAGDSATLDNCGIAMIIQDLDGRWIAQTFNEQSFLRNPAVSPDSNPYEEVEGYYGDLDMSVLRKNRVFTEKTPIDSGFAKSPCCSPIKPKQSSVKLFEKKIARVRSKSLLDRLQAEPNPPCKS